MLDLQEIENTIQELENADTTFDTCIKLSALYNVRDNLKHSTQQVITTESDNVTKELSDILPHYTVYKDAKRNYQLNKAGKETVIQYMQAVCQEIREFVMALYSSTDMSEERFLLYNGLNSLLSTISPE